MVFNYEIFKKADHCFNFFFFFLKRLTIVGKILSNVFPGIESFVKYNLITFIRTKIDNILGFIESKLTFLLR